MARATSPITRGKHLWADPSAEQVAPGRTPTTTKKERRHPKGGRTAETATLSPARNNQEHPKSTQMSAQAAPSLWCNQDHREDSWMAESATPQLCLYKLVVRPTVSQSEEQVAPGLDHVSQMAEQVARRLDRVS